MLGLFFVFLIVLSISAQQNSFQPSITCYMKYNHEETKSQKSNIVLAYSFDQSETTQYATTQGELCSKVGCGCFSYRGVCSDSSPGSNHFSQCTENDRRDRIVKWHRGWTSSEQCEQMHRHPYTYLNLTCCYTDRCNNQPGKITKIVDTQSPIQQYHPHLQQTVATPSLPIQRYGSHLNHPSTSQLPETYTSSPIYDNSLSLNSVSNWMIFLALTFCLLVIV